MYTVLKVISNNQNYTYCVVVVLSLVLERNEKPRIIKKKVVCYRNIFSSNKNVNY